MLRDAHNYDAGRQVVIDTDGMIFKCPAMVGQYKMSVGSVRDEALSSRYQEFMSFDLADYKGKCRDCAYLPFCSGGCNYHAELQTGDYRNVFCEKDFYDKTIREFIKIKYHQMVEIKAKREKKIQEQPAPLPSKNARNYRAWVSGVARS